ncbi:glycosyltransferase [Sphingobacterium multivorum]|uniref:glycosyltransferase n=1 Tax=Sphingobacterium multivorum TaxID=28454 RepID=UPI0036B049AF
MKILITVPTLLAGGMERAAVNFAEGLSKRGFDVKIFMMSSEVVFYKVSDSVEIIAGKKKLEDKWSMPLSFIKLRKLVRKFSPDYVFSFSGKISSYIMVSLLGLNTEIIPFHRGSPFATYGKLSDLFNRLMYPKASILAVQTERAKEVFKNKYGNSNIIVIPNPVRNISIDEEQIKRKVVLCVSRLVNGKGLENLIEYFNTIGYSEWEFHILGDGYLRDKLQKLINKLGCNNVKLLGFHTDVDYYFSYSSIFAFASESEGFPNSLLEAMCSGLPCISYDCPTGPAEMIIDGVNGFLVPLNNKVQYIDKLKKLMSDHNLRASFSKKAKELNYKHNSDRIIENFISELMLVKKSKD